MPLPSVHIERWTAKRKAEVVIAVWDGRISREEACRRYQLTDQEFDAWEAAFKTCGYFGLRATYLHDHRRRSPREPSR